MRWAGNPASAAISRPRTFGTELTTATIRAGSSPALVASSRLASVRPDPERSTANRHGSSARDSPDLSSAVSLSVIPIDSPPRRRPDCRCHYAVVGTFTRFDGALPTPTAILMTKNLSSQIEPVPPHPVISNRGEKALVHQGHI